MKVNAITIEFSRRRRIRGFNWAAYWAAQNINFHTIGRDGLTLPDEFGNDVTILPAYLYKPAGTEYYSVADNGELDIGGNDFTIFGWVKGENIAKDAYEYFLGKLVNGNTAGRYGFYIHQTTGRLSFYYQSNGAAATGIDSTVDVTDGWHFVLADINQATKKIRFFIDNIQIGGDATFVGVFPALANQFEFYIGTGNDAAGASTSLISKTSHSESGVVKRLLTPTEQTNAYNRIYPTDCEAFWPLMGGAEFSCDASGNGYHLTGSTAVRIYNVAKTRFSNYGSRYGLDNGFALYQNGFEEAYVPLKQDGTEITPTGIQAGYKKTSEGIHVGNSLKHNLANSIIAFSDAFWDRSNTAIWGEQARRTLSYYDATSAATKKYWHISELNNLQMQDWANVGYKGMSFVKVSNQSYKDRNTLDEILSFDDNKTDSVYSKIISSYCKDYVYAGIYENDYIYWKYTDDHLLYSRGLKVMKWENAATDKLHLSIDGALTYPYSVNSPVNGQTPKLCYIFTNGNILVAFNTAIYLSTDNLTSLNAITVKNIAGGDFAATENSYFRAIFDREITVGGVEIFVFGTYSVSGVTEYININAFYTVDSGVNIKSCYLAQTTNPPNLEARHIHFITHRDSDDSFWMGTGDSDASHLESSNIIRGVYDWDLDTWTWAKLYGVSGASYKWTSLNFYNGDANVLIGEDNNIADKLGLNICSIADLGDINNIVSLFKAKTTSSLAFLSGDNIISSLIGPANSNNIGVSKTGITGLYGNKLYGLPTDFYIAQHFNNANSNGWYLCSIGISGQANTDLYENGAFWVKIK